MPTEREDDLLNFAEAALTKYYRGSNLYRSLPDVDEGHFDFEVVLQSDDLRTVLATLQLVQLSFEAASVTAAYVHVEEYWGGRPNRDVLEKLAADTDYSVDLHIIEMSHGSIRVLLRLDPRSSLGRKKLLAIAAIASVLLTPFLGPLPNMAVTVMIGLNEFLSDEEKPSPRTIDLTQLPGEGAVDLRDLPADNPTGH